MKASQQMGASEITPLYATAYGCATVNSAPPGPTVSPFHITHFHFMGSPIFTSDVHPQLLLLLLPTRKVVEPHERPLVLPHVMHR